MILNVHALGRRQDCASTIELRGVEPHAHIGDKSAEHQHEVRRFHVFAHVFVAAHGAAINADVERMVFGNRAFAQKIGSDGNVHSLGHSHDQASHAITGQFDSGENYRFLCCANQGERFFECRFERVWIRFLRRGERESGYRNFAINNVVWHFNVNRAFVPQTCLNATDDLRSGALLIEQHRARYGHFIVNAALRFERFNLVMKKRIFFPIFASRSAAYNHNRRFLGIRAGDGIQNIESAHAVSHANQTDPVDARISVGGETRRRLMRHRDALDFRFLEPGKCRQREIAQEFRSCGEHRAGRDIRREIAQAALLREMIRRARAAFFLPKFSDATALAPIAMARRSWQLLTTRGPRFVDELIWRLIVTFPSSNDDDDACLFHCRHHTQELPSTRLGRVDRHLQCQG